MDHRKTGRLFNLFFFNELANGQVFFLPKGNIMLRDLKKIIAKNMQRRRFLEIKTPTLGKQDIWKMTGHQQKYHENMFFVDDWALKPMNCPMHFFIMQNIYSNRPKLPIKVYEINRCFRNEATGAVCGMLRLVSFQQDDSHTLARLEHVHDLLAEFVSEVQSVYSMFNLKICKYRFSYTTKERFIGSDWAREKSHELIRVFFQNTNLSYIEEDDGAFYGPKIDVIVQDRQNREWQLGTIQLDFCLLKNMGFKLIGSDSFDNCCLVHRAVLGTFERFLAVVLENEPEGKLPLAINPYVCIVCSIPGVDISGIKSYIESNYHDISEYIDWDDGDEDLRQKIKAAHEKPYTFLGVLGQKEVDGNSISIKQLKEPSIQNLISLDNFCKKMFQFIHEQRQHN